MARLEDSSPRVISCTGAGPGPMERRGFDLGFFLAGRWSIVQAGSTSPSGQVRFIPHGSLFVKFSYGKT